MRDSRAVALVEIAPGAYRNSERREVLRRYEVTVGERAFAHRRQRTAHDRHRCRCYPTGERHAIRERSRRRAGKRRETLIKLFVEGDQLVARVPLWRQRKLGGEHAVGLEAWLDALESSE